MSAQAPIEVDNQMESCGTWGLPEWRRFVYVELELNHIGYDAWDHAVDYRVLGHCAAYLCTGMPNKVRMLHYIQWAVAGLSINQRISNLNFLVQGLRQYAKKSLNKPVKQVQPPPPVLTPEMKEWLAKINPTK